MGGHILNYVDVEDEEAMAELRALIVIFTLEGAADFCMRMGSQVKQFPLLLVWLVFSPWNVVCQHRRRVAAQVLTHIEKDDGITWKLPQVFRQELEHCVNTGMLLNDELWNLLNGLTKMLIIDTQEVEGMNSILKRNVTIAPAILLPLAAARVMIKKELGTSGTPLEREDLVRACVDNHYAAQASLNSSHRFVGMDWKRYDEQASTATAGSSDSTSTAPLAAEGERGAATSATTSFR